MSALVVVCRECGDVIAPTSPDLLCDPCGENAWDCGEFDSRINDEVTCGDRLRA